VRIISGTARGTKLQSLDVPALRPMLDRVKEALFNILRNDMDGPGVLDLFSGSGALGLEALSRGARYCVFVEQDGALAGLARRNIRRCHMEERCEVLQTDVGTLPARRPPLALGGAEVVFADPPYAMVDAPNTRADLFDLLDELVGGWICPGGVVILHHRPLPHALWPGRLLREADQRVYGQSQLTFFTALEELQHE
jgi:16S rRNA (guanine(966)-N(2))-methyltransferase RsmD